MPDLQSPRHISTLPLSACRIVYVGDPKPSPNRGSRERSPATVEPGQERTYAIVGYTDRHRSPYGPIVGGGQENMSFNVGAGHCT
jgi:hypothetical protein